MRVKSLVFENKASGSPPPPQADPGMGGPDQGLGGQQTAVINLTGVGGFMSPQAAGMDAPPL